MWKRVNQLANESLDRLIYNAGILAVETELIFEHIRNADVPSFMDIERDLS